MREFYTVRMDKKLQLTAIVVCITAFAIVGFGDDAYAAWYAKFDGVDGESTDRGHEQWSDIKAFSQIITRGESDSTSRATSGAVFHDIQVTKELDKASPKLAEAIVKGKVFPKVEIQLTTGSETYYTIELTNVMITSYSVSGDADTVPMEQLSLNFEQIRTVYTEYDKDGSKGGNVEFSWKVEEGVS